ncbi:MAG: SBBP repeat-containing protein [Candidatus Thorarchaeota archaeon]
MKKTCTIMILLLITPLIISPVALGLNSPTEDYIYASFYGGSDRDVIIDVAINSINQTIIVGGTFSSDLPMVNGFQETYGGGVHGGNIHLDGGDGFVMLLDASGVILWSTYIGGSDLEVINSVEVDNDDNIYICGYTESENFPVTANATQSVYGGGESDGFIAKINNIGKLLYSSFCGDNQTDILTDIKIKSNGSIAVLGMTNSPAWNTTENAYQTIFGGEQDLLILQFSSNLIQKEIISYWGSIDMEYAYNLELDSNDNLIITGNIFGDHLLIQDALYDQFGGIRDIFILKLNMDRTTDFCTYLGGNQLEDPFGSAIDQEDNILISGRTASSNFPVVEEFQSTFEGVVDGIISVFSSNGQSLNYSTYLGGPEWDMVHDLSVTPSGKIYACGYAGPNFPVIKQIQDTPGGGATHTLIMMVMDGDCSIEFSSYFGNEREITPFEVENHQGRMIIVGQSGATTLPVSEDAAYSSNSGGYDGFLIIFDVESYLANYSASSTIANAPIMFYLFFILSIVSVLLVQSRKKVNKNDK